MKLVRADLEGFRRFTKAHIDLLDDVIAIVGPNEAGKTSLLQGLERLNSDEPWDSSDCTRGLSSEDFPSVSARFLLSQAEQHSAQDALGGGQAPRWLVIQKGPDGNRLFKLDPPLRRNLTPRTALTDSLEHLPNHARLKGYLSAIVAYREGENQVKRDLRSVAVLLKKYTHSDHQTLPFEALTLAAAIRGGLEPHVAKADRLRRASLLKLIKLLEEFEEVESAEHPSDIFLEQLNPRVPKLLLFSDRERQLQSEYGITAVTGPEPALRNLFELAKINVHQLMNAVQSQDHGRRSRIEEMANATLRNAFATSWSQSQVSAHLQFDEQKVRIQVDAPGTYSPIAERSDGLRAFIALFAFVSVKAPRVRPILLIDEAENHLHYDAQADLVNVFENQRIAAQVIYTTHSAGCLPSDLGTGIRVVRPIIRDGEDQGTSQINNSFWSTGAGFSPLILAMGASIMAIVPARRAIIAEGGSDVILLPAVLRAARKLDRLGFQIAPGLASVSERDVRELELEAPRVVYLVDGDRAGAEHRKKLRRAGIPAERILVLPSGKVPEDFVKKHAYLHAVNEELRRSHGGDLKIPLSKIGAQNRPQAVAAWCKAKGIPSPSKRRVASALAKSLRRGDTTLETRGEQQVIGLLDQIGRALGMPKYPTPLGPKTDL